MQTRRLMTEEFYKFSKRRVATQFKSHFAPLRWCVLRWHFMIHVIALECFSDKNSIQWTQNGCHELQKTQQRKNTTCLQTARAVSSRHPEVWHRLHTICVDMCCVFLCFLFVFLHLNTWYCLFGGAFISRMVPWIRKSSRILYWWSGVFIYIYLSCRLTVWIENKTLNSLNEGRQNFYCDQVNNNNNNNLVTCQTTFQDLFKLAVSFKLCAKNPNGRKYLCCHQTSVRWQRLGSKHNKLLRNVLPCIVTLGPKNLFGYSCA